MRWQDIPDEVDRAYARRQEEGKPLQRPVIRATQRRSKEFRVGSMEVLDAIAEQDSSDVAMRSSLNPVIPGRGDKLLFESKPPVWRRGSSMGDGEESSIRLVDRIPVKFKRTIPLSAKRRAWIDQINAESGPDANYIHPLEVENVDWRSLSKEAGLAVYVQMALNYRNLGISRETALRSQSDPSSRKALQAGWKQLDRSREDRLIQFAKVAFAPKDFMVTEAKSPDLRDSEPVTAAHLIKPFGQQFKSIMRKVENSAPKSISGARALQAALQETLRKHRR